jgi:hypothetical protein
MKHLKILGMGSALCFALTMGACKKDKESEMEQTLYEKLGGNKMVADPRNPGQMIEQGRLGLRSVVDSTIFVIAADPNLQPYFAPLLSEVTAGNLTGLTLLSRSLTNFFSVATGSKTATYDGMNMRDAHDPANNPRMAMKSNNKGYDDFISAVVKGAQQNNLPMPLIQEVGELIETLRSTIVQRG